MVKQKTDMKQIMNSAPVQKQMRDIFLSINSEIQTRTALISKLGKMYEGSRDLYTALGYKTTLDIKDFKAQYERGEFGYRLTNAYPDACWKIPPSVYETMDNKITAFEKSWEELIKAIPVFHYIMRADRLSGIGSYGVLYMGMDDVKTIDDAKNEAKASQLLFLRPYMQDQAMIETYETDSSSPRYGLPLTYTLTKTSDTSSSTGVSSSFIAHWTRCVHFAENREDSEVYGVSRMRNAFNTLQRLDMILGGSAEMFWRGGFPGFSFNLDPLANPTAQTLDTMKDEIEKYVHGMNRYLRLQGTDVKPLSPNIADPNSVFSINIQTLSAVSGIPKRILLGTEEGKLAGSQDDDHWNDRVDERRKNYAGPFVLLQMITLLQKAEVLPPSETVYIDWPDLDALTMSEQAEQGKKWADALTAYFANPTVESSVTLFDFLTTFCGIADEKAQHIVDNAVEVQDGQEEGEDDNSPNPPKSGGDGSESGEGGESAAKPVSDGENDDIAVNGGPGSGNWNHPGYPRGMGETSKHISSKMEQIRNELSKTEGKNTPARLKWAQGKKDEIKRLKSLEKSLTYYPQAFLIHTKVFGYDLAMREQTDDAVAVLGKGSRILVKDELESISAISSSESERGAGRTAFVTFDDGRKETFGPEEEITYTVSKPFAEGA